MIESCCELGPAVAGLSVLVIALLGCSAFQAFQNARLRANLEDRERRLLALRNHLSGGLMYGD